MLIALDRIEAEYLFVPAKDGRGVTVTGRKTLAVEHGGRHLLV